jgi:hypothetical protein
MRQSEQLERETEQTRAELAETLEELRARVTPGYLFDELLDYARNSTGGEFFDNLKRQVAGNPLPVSVMGAGLAWLMLANGRSARAASAPVQDDLASARDTAGSTYNSAAAVSAGMAESIRHTAADVTHSAKAFGAATAGTGRAFADFCREQPLVAAGIGIAIGAAIGAMLPSTETEDRLMGEASDEAKQRAKDMAVEQAEKAKAAVERGIDATRQEPQPQHAARREAEGVPAYGDEASLVPSPHETEAGVGTTDPAERRSAEVERELHAHAERLARERSE